MSLKLFGPINTGTTTGGAGTSTANATSTTPLVGEISAVYVKYNGSPPAGTTDVTVKTQGTSPAPPSVTFLTLTNAATDGYFYPRDLIDDLVGASIAANYTKVYIADYVTVTIAQADDGDSADVWLLMEC